jgi:hypothetical protein
VEVEVEVLYPADDPSEPCLEPDTVRWLDEIARKAAEGDVEFLQTILVGGDQPQTHDPCLTVGDLLIALESVMNKER